MDASGQRQAAAKDSSAARALQVGLQALRQGPLGELERLAQQQGLPLALVGGTLRDLAWGLPPRDLDLVVEGPATPLARALADRLGAGFVPLDPERDIARVVPPRGVYLDLARRVGPDLESDLRARDFTLNAVALRLNGEVVDPTAGLADLEARVLRLASPTAFEEDPLRLLRGVRFLAVYGLSPAPGLREALAFLPGRLARVAGERIREELALIVGAGLARQLPLLQETGLFEQVFPQHPPVDLALRLEGLLEEGLSFLGQCAVRAVERLNQPLTASRSRGFSLTLAALAAEAPAPVVESWVIRLVLSRDEAHLIQRVPGLARELPALATAPPGQLYRFFRRSGELAPEALVLGHAMDPSHPERVASLARSWFERDRLAAPVVPVTGTDLMRELDLSPGPRVGWLLEELAVEVAEGRVQSRGQALARASELLEGAPP